MTINWSCQHSKKFSSSQASINSCVKLSKTQFPLWVSFKNWKNSMIMLSEDEILLSRANNIKEVSNLLFKIRRYNKIKNEWCRNGWPCGH